MELKKYISYNKCCEPNNNEKVLPDFWHYIPENKNNERVMYHAFYDKKLNK